MNYEAKTTSDNVDEASPRVSEAGRRGVLKIFFGASAGVGKTYAMLADAHQRFEAGLDVVIGVVETHGRKETDNFICGIPVLPRRSGTEFDLDEAIQRKPALILLDELAHINAPGSRHPKRWQDVEELLSQGIDVYTTLSVQHLESLNDVVFRLSGMQVRETIPDTVFDKADDIVLVDLPSDELLTRLQEGKVHVDEHVQLKATEDFFKRSNLVALRELALRRTAERVDAQMGRDNPAKGVVNTFVERIMVCLGHDMLSTRVLRQAKRLSVRIKAPLYAVYIQTNRHYHLTPDQQRTVQRNLLLAERLGAQVHTLHGENALEELLAFANTHGITRLLLGHRRRPRIKELLTGSLAEQLVRHATNIEVSIISDTAPAATTKVARASRLKGLQPLTLIAAALVVVLCTVIAIPFRNEGDPVNLITFYLVGIVAVAARYGTLPSILATFLSVIAFNFFLMQPYFSLHDYEARYFYTFGILLITGIMIGMMAGRLRVQAMFFRHREREVASLYELTRELSTLRDNKSIAECAVRHVSDTFNMTANIWLADEMGILRPVATNGIEEDALEMSAAEWAYKHRQEAGKDTDTLTEAHGYYIPLIAHEEAIGVIGLIADNDYKADSEQTVLLEAFANILASSLLRALHSKRSEERKIEAESEKLRSVLLSSISHDLRIPLSSINGIASSLLLSKQAMPANVSDALRSIHAQTSRLTRIVTNLLDITQLKLGQLSLNRQPYFIEEVIGTALLHTQDTREQREIDTDILAINHLIEIDGLLIEQVLVNLFENAIQFTKPDGRIWITVDDADGEKILICVADNGIGVSDEIKAHIFDKFYNVADEEKEPGTGLGLAICRAIVELHGGSIQVENNTHGGATFSFTLPRKAPSLNKPAKNTGLIQKKRA